MTSTPSLDVVPDPVSRAALALEASRSTDGLGDAIAELAARLHAATYELLVLLREFDERQGWNNGFFSCAHWLHWRTGIDLGASREKVRVAKALASLPLVSATMHRGAISYAKVRAITRVATPATEASLLDLALAGTAAHVERFVRAWRRVDRVQEARDTEVRHLRRELSTWVDDDGMVVIRGRLTPELGAVVQRALEAASDRLLREAAGAPNGDAMAEELTPGQRRADALGLLAEAALSADLDRGTAGDRYQVVLHAEQSETASDAPASRPARAAPVPDSVVTDSHPRDGALESDDDAERRVFDGVLEVGDGAERVSAETSRRLACDASVVVMRHDASGAVLDVGRKTRTIPPAIRRALQSRDTRCRFPGCTARRCDVHHVEHWADGGATRLENLVLLCRRHYRAVHEGGFAIAQQPDGSATFFRPDGKPLEAAPAPPRWDRSSGVHGRDVPAPTPAPAPVHPLDPVTAHLAAAGITIGPRAAAVWDGTPFELAWAIDVVRGSTGDVMESSSPASS